MQNWSYSFRGVLDVPNDLHGIIPRIARAVSKVCLMDVPCEAWNAAGRPRNLGYVLK